MVPCEDKNIFPVIVPHFEQSDYHLIIVFCVFLKTSPEFRSIDKRRMPISLIPSFRTASLWSSRINYVARLELIVMTLTICSLPFMTAHSVQHIDLKAMPQVEEQETASTFLFYPGPPHSRDIAYAKSTGFECTSATLMEYQCISFTLHFSTSLKSYSVTHQLVLPLLSLHPSSILYLSLQCVVLNVLDCRQHHRDRRSYENDE